jgi:hypothetical protein
LALECQLKIGQVFDCLGPIGFGQLCKKICDAGIIHWPLRLVTN